MGPFSFIHDRFERLAARMQQGDERAARELYDELLRKVYGFCMARVSDRAVAEDLTQDIFLKLVSHIAQFDSSKGRFLVWFWRLARNTVIDHYRRGKEMVFSDLPHSEEDQNPEESLAWVEGPERETERQLTLGHVNVFLAKLDQEEQELFRLRFVAELSYREIADILGRNEGALRVATSRLKKKINHHFST